MSDYISSGAIISSCERYRYLLWREWRGTGKEENYIDRGATDGAGHQWKDAKPCVFVMLNPSTADGETDDPTIRKCVKFAKRWGFDRLEVVNLFAYRATNTKELLKLNHDDDPASWQNQTYVERATEEAGRIICGWGQHGSHLGQDQTVLGWMLGPAPQALRISPKTGQPWHPLYIPDDTEPVPFDLPLVA